jgi:hypothetical protein
MEKGFYNTAVGYWQAISDPSVDVMENYPAGTIEVPLMPGPGYTFNGTSWIEPSVEWKTATAAQKIRSERLFRLVKQVDPIASNTLRWSALSAEQQQQLIAYRQDLLDITEAPGFPWYETVISQGVDTAPWPSKPDFI